MRKALILFTSSYPFGSGEAFVDGEMPFLLDGFDEVVVVSNDIASEVGYDVPSSVTCLRRDYALSWWEKLLSGFGWLDGAVRRELATVRDDYGVGPTRRALSTVLVSWYKAGKFSRILRKLASGFPDAEVHAYSYWANDMALAAARARRNGWVAKAYCRAHGWDVYFERAEAGFLPFRTFLATHLDHYFFVSEHARQYSRERWGLPDSGARVAHLGTRPVGAHACSSLFPFRVLSCSSMIPLKRVDLIAESLGHMTREVEWTHIGDGPTRPAVEAICRGLPSNVRVKLVGQLPHADVMDAFTTSRPSLFLNVSSTEGLPVSMMEAMSVGVPVMGTDVGGVREIVSDGSNGILLPSDPAPGGIASALEDFAALSEEEHAALSQGARATWDADFNAETNYRAFLRVIRD